MCWIWEWVCLFQLSIFFFLLWIVFLSPSLMGHCFFYYLFHLKLFLLNLFLFVLPFYAKTCHGAIDWCKVAFASHLKKYCFSSLQKKRKAVCCRNICWRSFADKQLSTVIWHNVWNCCLDCLLLPGFTIFFTRQNPKKVFFYDRLVLGGFTELDHCV